MDRRRFFDIMGTAPATVTVVTTIDGTGQPRGMTVGAVTSVSAEPPSLLVSIDARSTTLTDLISAEGFVVNYLRGDRAGLSQRFASSHPDRFESVEWRPGSSGMPILYADSLSWLECRTEQVIPAGDHVLIIGAVEDGVAPPPNSRPLMYFRHNYEEWPGAVGDDEFTAQPSDAPPNDGQEQSLAVRSSAAIDG